MMELTLTGASLNDDKGSTTQNSDSTADVATGSKNHDQEGGKECSHKHNHNKDQPCCANHPPSQVAPMEPRKMNIEDMIKNNPAQLCSVLLNILKGGQYTVFAHIAAVILEHEKSTGMSLQVDKKVVVTPPTPNYTGTFFGMYMADGHSLVHWAAKRADDMRFMNFFATLPDVDLHLKSTDSVGMTPLHWAATEGSIPIVALLLNNLESTDSNTTTTLKDSSSSSSSLMMESSDSRVVGIKKDAVINVRDNSGCTPLLIAAQYGHADLAAFLIRKGANPNAVDDSRDTALHWAAYKGSVDVCGLLMHLNGVDTQLSTKDTYGQTPLHLASLRGCTDVVRYLLEQAETSTYRQSSKISTTSTDSISRVGSRSLSSSSASQLDGVSSIGSSSSSSSLPKTLLTMSDRDGKTPLDLALKKNKVAVELLLKDYMDKYCNDSSSSIRYFLKKVCSLSNWKVWFGLAQGSIEVQPPKAIFWSVVIFQLIGTVFIEFYLFLPIFSRSSMEEGRLWDCTILNCLRFTFSILMWLSFILCHETDPGTLSNASLETKRQLTYLCNDNMEIKRKMETLTKELHKLYDQTLDSYADVCHNKNQSARLPLCHTCHIAKPLRSKHCRVSNKCILLFDHHCPFLGTTIGLYNYRYFFSYLVTMTVLIFHFIITWVTYVRRGDKIQWGWLALFIFLSIFILMTGGLLAYHIQLISKNLSTNEHQNVWRYTYLRDEYGRYFNPFHRGFCGNFYTRLFPGPDAYILPGRYSVSDSFPSNNNHDSDKKEKSDSESEEKQQLMETFV